MNRNADYLLGGLLGVALILAAWRKWLPYSLTETLGFVTGAFATAIWHRRYMGDRSPAVESIAARHRRPDLYLLTDVDTPFVQDGTRDGETIRAWMHQAFVAELAAWRRPYRLLTGSWAERLAQAVGHVDDVLVTPGSKSPARPG